MELNQRHKNLIVFLEIDRCMSDAVQSVTGCSMGKRTLKQMYYGKFAATFYNQDTGEALRITDADANKKFKDEETKEEMIARFRRTPPEELFKVDKVKIELSKGDMPGKPYTTAFCSVCGEKQTQAIAKIDHTWGDIDVLVEPTCYSEGSGTHTCTVCGTTENVILEMISHTWKDWVVDTAATCEVAGYRHHICEVCNEVAGEEI